MVKLPSLGGTHLVDDSDIGLPRALKVKAAIQAPARGNRVGNEPLRIGVCKAVTVLVTILGAKITATTTDREENTRRGIWDMMSQIGKIAMLSSNQTA